jgi:hypothetical protein
MTKTGWSKPFEEAITLPDGRKLITRIPNFVDLRGEIVKCHTQLRFRIIA